MSLLQATNIVTHPIEEGEAGIILRKDGSFQIFNTHKIDPHALSERVQDDYLKLVAMSVILTQPDIFRLALDSAKDMGLFEQGQVFKPRLVS